MPASVVATLRAAGCVWAEDEAELIAAAAADPAELAAMVDRRVGGMPLAHVLGSAELCGTRVTVHPGVFVPRARTALLVRQAAALVAGREATVVDLCCGSGALGAAIARLATGEGGRVRLSAADIDPVAVACARENLAPWDGRVYQGDLCAALPADLRGRVDVLVANVPYVPTRAISLLPPEFRLFEPLAALDGGDDGLDVLRRVAAQAPRWLAAHGHLLVETGRDQAPAAVEVMDRAGLDPRIVRDDELETTAVIGERR